MGKWVETKREFEIDAEGNEQLKKTVTELQTEKRLGGIVYKDIVDMVIKLVGLTAVIIAGANYFLALEKQKEDNIRELKISQENRKREERQIVEQKRKDSTMYENQKRSDSIALRRFEKEISAAIENIKLQQESELARQRMTFRLNMYLEAITSLYQLINTSDTTLLISRYNEIQSSIIPKLRVMNQGNYADEFQKIADLSFGRSVINAVYMQNVNEFRLVCIDLTENLSSIIYSMNPDSTFVKAEVSEKAKKQLMEESNRLSKIKFEFDKNLDFSDTDVRNENIFDYNFYLLENYRIFFTNYIQSLIHHPNDIRVAYDDSGDPVLDFLTGELVGELVGYPLEEIDKANENIHVKLNKRINQLFESMIDSNRLIAK